MVIPFGGRIVRWRADKGGEYTREKFRQYCLETGIIQEAAATNTPQHIDVFENVERTLCAMVRCILADSGFPSSMWGELFMTAAYLKNRTSHKALKMETPFKILHGEEAAFWYFRVIGVRAFVYINDFRKLDAAAWEGKVCDYSKESKSYRVWNPKTHHVVESRNVTFIDTPSHLLLPPSKFSPLQDLVGPSWDVNVVTLDNDYISYDDLLRNVRDYTGVLDFTANAPANHENASGVSAYPQVQELVDQIHDLTRRDLLTPAAPLPGAALPAEPLPGAVREPLSGGASPPSERGASQETEELSPALCQLHQKGDCYAQQQSPSAQRRNTAGCRGADGRGYPLQGSTPK